MARHGNLQGGWRAIGVDGRTDDHRAAHHARHVSGRHRGPGRTKAPLSPGMASDVSGRSSGSPDLLRPSRTVVQWHTGEKVFYGLTAAGPLPIHTGFPIKPLRAPDLCGIGCRWTTCQARCHVCWSRQCSVCKKPRASGHGLRPGPGMECPVEGGASLGIGGHPGGHPGRHPAIWGHWGAIRRARPAGHRPGACPAGCRRSI